MEKKFKCNNCKEKSNEIYIYCNEKYCIDCLKDYFIDKDYIQDKYFNLFLEMDCEKLNDEK